MAKWIATYRDPLTGLAATVKVRAENDAAVTLALESYGAKVLRVVREARIGELDVEQVAREARKAALADGDWDLLADAPTGQVARNWVEFYSRPGSGEDWYAADAAATKAREAAREAFRRIRWQWAGARRARWE
jgi:hypothetical protein